MSAPLEPIVLPAADIVPRAIEHLWPNVLFVGKVTLLVGDPGLGKSLVTLDIASRVTRGAAWPLNCANPDGPGDVLVISAEDDVHDTLVPRLKAAGADLKRVLLFSEVRETRHGRQRVHTLALDKHLEQLTNVAKEKEGALRLVIVDPILAFTGNAGYQNAKVRALITELARIATEQRFAIILVSHLVKSSRGPVLHRIAGSFAFGAACRANFVVQPAPHDATRRWLLPLKNNLTPSQSGFSYTINASAGEPPHIEWADEPVTEDLAADQGFGTLLGARDRGIDDRVDRVCTWLMEALAVERQPAANMWRLAEQKRFSRRDVDRAKEKLGIIAVTVGFPGVWYWELPRALH